MNNYINKKMMKIYSRKQSNLKTVDDYIMDYIRRGFIAPPDTDIQLKNKRKLFYKFVKRLPKRLIYKFEVNEDFFREWFTAPIYRNGIMICANPSPLTKSHPVVNHKCPQPKHE